MTELLEEVERAIEALDAIPARSLAEDSAPDMATAALIRCRSRIRELEERLGKVPEVGPVHRYSADGIFVGAVESRFFVEAQRRHGVWTFFLPRPDSPQEARWFAGALYAAADEAERG